MFRLFVDVLAGMLVPLSSNRTLLCTSYGTPSHYVIIQTRSYTFHNISSPALPYNLSPVRL